MEGSTRTNASCALCHGRWHAISVTCAFNFVAVGSSPAREIAFSTGNIYRDGAYLPERFFFDGLNDIQDRTFERLIFFTRYETYKSCIVLMDRPKWANAGEIRRFKPYLNFWSSGKMYNLYTRFETTTRDNGDYVATLYV